MIWGERWEGNSGLGTHVHPWQIHVNVWQNQYSVVKLKKKKERKKEINTMRYCVCFKNEIKEYLIP